LRNKILYLLTENLNFFYRLNRELNRRNIQFKILSGISKIPDLHSLILATSGDLHDLQINYKKVKVMTYDEKDDFNHYIFKILAAYRIEYKEFYSKLIFSIDPGLKKIGLVVFLDDYYLVSHTFYDKIGIIKIINDYINCFQTNNPNLLKLVFKFGSGVLPLTLNLIQDISKLLPNRKDLKFLLIDESKSSKIRIQGIKKKFRTKHELSALILALRDGVEVDQLDNLKKYKQIRFQDSNNIIEQIGDFNESTVNLEDIINKILNDEISLSESYEMLS
jgi:hypothetical protein